MGVLVHSAKGGQESRRGGGADPEPWHPAWGVRARGKPCQSLVEPERLLRQGVDHSVCEHCDRDLVKARQVLETAASSGYIREAVAGLRTPRPATLAGLPLCQNVGTAVEQESLWSGLGW